MSIRCFWLFMDDKSHVSSEIQRNQVCNFRWIRCYFSKLSGCPHDPGPCMVSRDPLHPRQVTIKAYRKYFLKMRRLFIVLTLNTQVLSIRIDTLRFSQDFEQFVMKANNYRMHHTSVWCICLSRDRWVLAPLLPATKVKSNLLGRRSYRTTAEDSSSTSGHESVSFRKAAVNRTKYVVDTRTQVNILLSYTIYLLKYQIGIVAGGA